MSRQCYYRYISTALDVWDLDGSIRRGSLASDAIAYCIEAGWTQYEPENLAEPTRADIRAFVQMTVGRSLAEFASLSGRITEEARLHSFPWAIERLEEQVDRGDTILLLSRSPAFLVRAFARGLGVFNHASGSYFHTKDMVFSGRARTLNKLSQLRRFQRAQGLGRTAIAFAAGDHMHDVPILELAEHAVAVNPRDQLLKLALHRGWEIVNT